MYHTRTPSGQARGRNKRCDHLFTHTDLPRPLAPDVSVTSSLADSYVAAARTQYGAADLRARAKVSKHQAGAEFNSVEFIPLAFEALGAWGQHARD